MKTLLRTYLAITLALLLALTGQSMAVARGATGPVGQVTLCTGTGPVMVYVDENGTPTGPPVFCPDFTLNLLVAVAMPDMMAVPVFVREDVAPARLGFVQNLRPRGRARARAPPLMI